MVVVIQSTRDAISVCHISFPSPHAIRVVTTGCMDRIYSIVNIHWITRITVTRTRISNRTGLHKICVSGVPEIKLGKPGSNQR